MEFELGQEQVMIPSMRFEGVLQLEARLDRDGNAMTREPGELTGRPGGTLEPGATGVEIVLSDAAAG